MKAYNSTPEVKARRKAYYSTPEVKARRKAYDKAYNSTPEVKARMKAYYSTPEVKYSLRKIRSHYQMQKQKLEKKLRQYPRLSIPEEGKLVSLGNLIDNLNGIEKYVSGLDRSIRKRAENQMLQNLLEEEGTIVSWRKELPYSNHGE